MSKKEILKQNEDIPSYLLNLDGVGNEDLTNEISMPFIKIVQKLSLEIEEGTAKYGDIINSITKEKLQDENGKVDFIVVKHFIDYKIFEEGGGGLKDRSSNGIDWVNGSVIPTVDIWRYKYYNFLVILVKDLDLKNPPLYILSMGKTSANTGKSLVSLMYQTLVARNLPIFAKPFTLVSVEMQNESKQKYMIFSISPSSIEWTPEKSIDGLKETRKFLDEDKKHLEIADTTNF